VIKIEKYKETSLRKRKSANIKKEWQKTINKKYIKLIKKKICFDHFYKVKFKKKKRKQSTEKLEELNYQSQVARYQMSSQ
jgi:hypothetical protein